MPTRTRQAHKKKREQRAGRPAPLFATIGHDLRAPLAAITMGATFARRQTPEGPETERTRRVLDAVLRSCGQLERLIRNFSDLSSIEDEHVELRTDTHDAGELLELAARGSTEATAKGVTVELERPDGPSFVTCDRDRILRALVHLVDNAVAASPEGGAVELSICEDGDTIAFLVEDRGSGFSSEARERFDARGALRVGRPPLSAGHGFGLAVAGGFATAHGGALQLLANEGATTLRLAVPRGGPPRPR